MQYLFAYAVCKYVQEGSFCSRIPTKHVELVRIFMEILSLIYKRLIFLKRFKFFTAHQNQINGENLL